MPQPNRLWCKRSIKQAQSRMCQAERHAKYLHIKEYAMHKATRTEHQKARALENYIFIFEIIQYIWYIVSKGYDYGNGYVNTGIFGKNVP